MINKINNFLDSKPSPNGLFWTGVIDVLFWGLCAPLFKELSILGAILSIIVLICFYLKIK